MSRSMEIFMRDYVRYRSNWAMMPTMKKAITKMVVMIRSITGSPRASFIWFVFEILLLLFVCVDSTFPIV